MHKKLSEKHGAKFPAITRGYSMVKFAHLDADPFFGVFYLQTSPLESRSLQQKEKKREKRKSEKEFKKYSKPNLERRRSLYFLVSKF